jgi:hypothetical protein
MYYFIQIFISNFNHLTTSRPQDQSCKPHCSLALRRYNILTLKYSRICNGRGKYQSEGQKVALGIQLTETKSIGSSVYSKFWLSKN